MTFSGYELVPTDVQQALLKAYDEQNSSEVLPPTRKSNSLFRVVLMPPFFLSCSPVSSGGRAFMSASSLPCHPPLS